jgi:hypothetical protein
MYEGEAVSAPLPPSSRHPDTAGSRGRAYWNGSSRAPTAPADAPPKTKRSTPARAWLIVLGVLLLCPGSCVVVGCSNRARVEGEPKTELVDLSLPESSYTFGVMTLGSEQQEHWTLAAEYDQSLPAIRNQLPVGNALQDIPWCTEDTTIPGGTGWIWATTSGKPAIRIFDDRSSDQRGYPAMLSIYKSTNDSTGCEPASSASINQPG